MLNELNQIIISNKKDEPRTELGCCAEENAKVNVPGGIQTH
jgi:hypothetical protein